MSRRLLIVEDEAPLRRLLEEIFRREGYDVGSAETAQEGLRALRLAEPDLLLLDILLPDGHGVELCREIRTVSAVPIVFLTALQDEEDVVAGLRAGGDDYVTKPFRTAELLARVEAVLRGRALARSEPGAGLVELDEGRFVLDSAARSVRILGEEVNLTPREFAILDYLVLHAGRPVPHRELVSYVWGAGQPNRVEDLRTYVRLIRRKIEADPSKPRYLQSRAGVGYLVPRI